MCARIRIVVLIFLFVTTHAVAARATSYQWSYSFGDSADQTVTCAALDNSGNVIVVGHFDGTVDFGAGPLTCNGPSDCTFLAKLDASGGHVWSRSLGDSLDLGTNLLSVDGASSVLVANDFRGTVDFGGGPVVAQGFYDGIIAKFDAQGNHAWSRNFGGTNALVQVEAAGADPQGNLIVAGTFTGTIDFGGATLTATSFVTNMFIVKFDPTGAHVWSQKRTGGLIVITGLVADNDGNVIVAGYHGAAFDFGGGSLASDPYNAFLAKYNAAGNHLWSKSLGDSATFEYAFDVAADFAGNIVITGHFRDPFDLGGGELTGNGGWDMYVAKFSPSGSHLWSQSFGDGSTQRGYTVATDNAGNVVLGGHSFGSIDFGGGPLVGDPIDFCVAMFDASGNHQWSQRLDVHNLGLPNDKPYSIAAAASATGGVAFVGTFKDAVDCGGGSLAGNGGWDTFVARFGSLATAIPTHAAKDLRLRAYPNPFNPQTTIHYSIPQSGAARLRLYDVSGRHIRTLFERWTTAGEHATRWDGRDNAGRIVASGVYFVRLESAGSVLTNRIVLLK
jgi:hypothetical protein